MSDAVMTEEPREKSGFFGAEQAQITEELPAEIWGKIDDFLEANPGGQERLIPLLHMAQESVGYLPTPIQEYVADKLGLSPIQVFGVVSFYHFFTTTPRGKHELKVCMGTACFVRHAQRLVEILEQALDIEVGDVTEDRLFSLEQVRCLGACGLAPAMMLNDETLGNLTAKELRKKVLRMKSKARREKATHSSETPSD
jgi:NADH-quinone oxidoreductase subunit E/NADP-reducing hydrogenase subunit HndA